MSTPAGLSAKPCVDAIVAGDGHEVFGLTSAGSLQDVSGRCVALEAGKVEFRQCSNVGRSVGDDRGGASQSQPLPQWHFLPIMLWAALGHRV